MKKIIMVLLVFSIALMTFVSCTSGNDSGFNASRSINVVSREDGSGTRGAFVELFGIEEKTSDGKKTDKTTKEAIIANKTDVMLTNISGDKYGIGYISLGSLNDSVKAVKIDGVEATAENIINKSYKIARPFNIATKGAPSDVAKDFIDFILSKQGQEVVSKNYIKIIADAPAYDGSKPTGKITIAGSSSVSPIMEKLKEAYVAINPNATIEIQQNDSSTGMKAAMDGTCDIGMASRDLKDSEKQQLKSIEIALDGVAVIVNPENTNGDLTTKQVKEIFKGEKTSWDELK